MYYIGYFTGFNISNIYMWMHYFLQLVLQRYQYVLPNHIFISFELHHKRRNYTLKDTNNYTIKDTNNYTIKDTNNYTLKDTHNYTIKGTNNYTIKDTNKCVLQ